MSPIERRRFLRALFASSGASLLAGCDRLSQTGWVGKVLASGEIVSKTSQRLVTRSTALVREFSEAMISPDFRGNGSTDPQNPAYLALAADEFRHFRLEVSGMVSKPLQLSLEDLRALPDRTQITRHDCVEGWSAIGMWKGPQLGTVLDMAGVLTKARFIVFRCFDSLDGGMSRYYESIDLEDARHPQTILAYELNKQPLPIKNGAPLRVRVERQLGYKMAKYISKLELVDSLAGIEGGHGGYWEDQGYEWYAGI